MFGLGIPTTRAGSVIMSTTAEVMRDVKYTGNPIMENCAVISRISKSFFRFGSFESREADDSEAIKQLAQYVWKSLLTSSRASPNASFQSVVTSDTAKLIAKWNAVGFTHGVLNTDNMSIISETIDYGPFGFIENFDPHFIPNTSDKFGRYAFSEQAKIGLWNLCKLNESLRLHLESECIDFQHAKFGYRRMTDQQIENIYWQVYNEEYNWQMRKKLGIVESVSPIEFAKIFSGFLNLLSDSAVDYTYTFRVITEGLSYESSETIAKRILSTVPPKERIIALSSSVVKIGVADLPEIEQFAATRLPELERVGIDLRTIERWKFNINRMERWGGSNADQSDLEDRWVQWLDKLLPMTDSDSRERMKKANPIYIPRQSLMEKAIKDVEERGDMTEVRKLLGLFLNPYMRDPSVDPDVYEKPDMTVLCSSLSCSS